MFGLLIQGLLSWKYFPKINKFYAFKSSYFLVISPTLIGKMQQGWSSTRVALFITSSILKPNSCFVHPLPLSLDCLPIRKDKIKSLRKRQGHILCPHKLESQRIKLTVFKISANIKSNFIQEYILIFNSLVLNEKDLIWQNKTQNSINIYHDTFLLHVHMRPLYKDTSHTHGPETETSFTMVQLRQKIEAMPRNM